MSRVLSLFVFIFLLSGSCFAASIGIGGIMETSPYVDTDYIYTPVPILKYENDYFVVDSPSVGVKLFTTDNLKVVLKVDYTSLKLKPSGKTKMLDARDAELFGGVHAILLSKYGIGKFNVSYGLTSSNGVRVQAAYAAYFEAGEHYAILPEVGVFWFNEKYNNYFYGVSAKEAAASGFSKYDADAGFTPYVSVVNIIKPNDHVHFLLKGQYSFYPEAAKGSPITDKESGFFLYAGVMYNF